MTGESSWKSPQQRNKPARRQQQLASLSQDPFAPPPTKTFDAAKPRARDPGRVPFSDRSSAEDEGYRSSDGGRGTERGGRKREEEEEVERLEREVRRLKKEAATAAGRIREAIIRADQADADALRLREEIACLERECEEDRVRFSDVVRRGSEVHPRDPDNCELASSIGLTLVKTLAGVGRAEFGEGEGRRGHGKGVWESPIHVVWNVSSDFAFFSSITAKGSIPFGNFPHAHPQVRRLGEELDRCVEREGMLQDR